MVCPSRPYHFKLFKACLPQILLDPFLNNLTQISLWVVAFPLEIEPCYPFQRNKKQTTDVNWGPCLTLGMECFVKMINSDQPLISFTGDCILEVRAYGPKQSKIGLETVSL